MTAVFIKEGQGRLTDFCCNRVYIVLDPKDNVVDVPYIG